MKMLVTITVMSIFIYIQNIKLFSYRLVKLMIVHCVAFFYRT